MKGYNKQDPGTKYVVSFPLTDGNQGTGDMADQCSTASYALLLFIEMSLLISEWAGLCLMLKLFLESSFNGPVKHAPLCDRVTVKEVQYIQIYHPQT